MLVLGTQRELQPGLLCDVITVGRTFIPVCVEVIWNPGKRHSLGSRGISMIDLFGLTEKL